MKALNILFFTIIFTLQATAQNDFIQIETNKVICLLSFLEASSNQSGSSSSYTSVIMEHLEGDDEFLKQVSLYSELNLEYSAKRDKYPEKRHNYINTKDLLWVAASNATDISDFGERIIGYLPHITHVNLIRIIKSIEPYYDNLVWNNEQENIKRIEEELAAYKLEIANLFVKVSGFYNAQWDKNVPFKVSLYPIPIKHGMTTAIPKGNALICGYMTEDKLATQGLIGVAIHEMCHIIYDEQSLELQNQIDEWYTSSESPFAELAYTYLNEGLATALGNGWAYKQINGSLDTAEWYADKYINGFGHALYPMVNEYIIEDKSMDQEFVKKSIALFEKTFPKAVNDPNILMNKIVLLANTNEDKEIDEIFNSLFSKFNIQSINLSIPINDPRSIDFLAQSNTTKLFVINSEHEKTIEYIDNFYTHIDIETPLNSMDVIFDAVNNSYMIIINIEQLSYLSDAVNQLSMIEQLVSGKQYTLKTK